MNRPTLISKKPEPDTDNWYDYIIKADQETPNRLEDAAKFLASMISISLTILITIGGRDSFTPFKDEWYMKLSVALWIISLITSFFVLFPRSYKYNSQSAQDIKRVHRKIIKTKQTLLLISLLLFLSALSIAALIFFGF